MLFKVVPAIIINSNSNRCPANKYEGVEAAIDPTDRLIIMPRTHNNKNNKLLFIHTCTVGNVVVILLQ